MNINSIASLPEAERARILLSLTDAECEALVHDWRFLARDEQIAPDGDWLVWLILAGRGFGKTRSGAEWVREQVMAGEGRIALIAPTSADARDIMIEGESGILSCCWAGDRDWKGNPIGRPQYEPSKRRLTWENGAVATAFSAEEPERLRGPQHGAGWCDELAAWKYLRETWDMFMFGLRLGNNPRACVTTTPKPLTLLRELVKDKRTKITRGSTFDNAANLAGAFLATVKSKYEGTRLGRQELYAEVLDEAEGALWTRERVEAAYVGRPKGDEEWKAFLSGMARIVVAIDPATTAKEESDETGIVVTGLGRNGFGYLLEDQSGRYSPGDWAKKAIELFKKYGADRIVAEGNQGGDMVRHTIQTEWPNAPVRIVHASRGKAARAEPVAALYEQDRIKHLGAFPVLEDQLVTWEPLSGLPSPDRLDALVWGFTELMVTVTGRTPLFGTYSGTAGR